MKNDLGPIDKQDLRVCVQNIQDMNNNGEKEFILTVGAFLSARIFNSTLNYRHKCDKILKSTF
jgi:hypothetical protein